MSDTTNKTVTDEVTPITKSRIHVDEFLSNYSSLSEVYKAGFRATVDKTWMFEEEWEQALSEYNKPNSL